MLTGRQKEILSYLKEDEYVTTSFIASQMDLSDKTIRNELKLIEETLSDVVEINTIIPKIAQTIWPEQFFT